MCSLLHAYLLVVLPLKSMVAPLSVFILGAYASMYLSCDSSEACTFENTRFFGLVFWLSVSCRLGSIQMKSWERVEREKSTHACRGYIFRHGFKDSSQVWTFLHLEAPKPRLSTRPVAVSSLPLLLFFSIWFQRFLFKHNGIRFNRILPRVAGKNFL